MMSTVKHMPGWKLVAPLVVGALTACTGYAGAVAHVKTGTFKADYGLKTDRYGRSLLMHVPEHYAPDRPWPLVVVLHGAFSSARDIMRLSEWNTLADREDFIVAYPQGIGLLGLLRHWNAGHCCGKGARDEWDDVTFLEQSIDRIAEQYAVDARRIYVVGFSNGGMLAYRFAAERGHRIAGFAAVSAAIGSRATPDDPEWVLPPPAVPVPALIIHGNADPIVPFGGGQGDNPRRARVYAPVSAAVEFWKEANRSEGEPRRAVLHDGKVATESWTDGAGRNEVRTYRIEDWAHIWPGGAATGNLPDHDPLKGFDAAPVIWDFFNEIGYRE